MSKSLGISFSSKAIHVALVSEGKIQYVKAVPYPFTFDFNSLFLDDNIFGLVNVISWLKQEKGITDLDLNISLPVNFALIKKISLPLENSDEELFSLMKWELGNYLPRPIENYKVIKTDIEFNFESHKEITTICIDKSIIQKLISLAGETNSVLKELVLDNFSLESYLASNNLRKSENNQIAFKVNNYSIDTHVFIRGKYFISYLDPLKNHKTETERFDEINRITKDRLNQVQNLLKQLHLNTNNSFQVFVYGEELSDNIIDSMKTNFSDEILKLPVPLEGSAIEEVSVEALGVLNT